MKRVRLLTMFTLLLMFGLAVTNYSASALSETRDPFVAHPMGPYTLLSNPASVMDTKAMTIRAAIGQGVLGGDTTQLIAYSEPDMGLGAGALLWYRTILSSGSKYQEVAYTMSHKITQGVFYGLTLKHVSWDAVGNWAADLGFLTTDLSSLRAGIVIHNFLGQDTINPTHVTASVSYDLMDWVGISLSLSTPTLSDQSQYDIGFAVDVPFSEDSRLRLGRVMNLSSSEGYWLGGLSIDVNTVTIDATVLLNQGTDRRVAMGIAYRF